MERRAVLFDLDGTLLDSEPTWAAAMTDLVRSLRPGSPLPDDAIGPMVTAGLSGMPTTAAVTIVHERLGLAPDGIPAAVRRLERDVIARRPGRWRPGVPGLLAGLRAAGCGTALVTSNSRDVVDRVLAGGMRTMFDTVVCVEDVRRVKPDPEPYLLAADRLGVDPRRCVAVEDSAAGVSSAIAAGCVVVQFDATGAEPHRAGLDVVTAFTGLGAATIHRLLDRPR